MRPCTSLQTSQCLSQYSVRYVILTHDSKSKTIHLEVSQNDKLITTSRLYRRNCLEGTSQALQAVLGNYTCVRLSVR